MWSLHREQKKRKSPSSTASSRSPNSSSEARNSSSSSAMKFRSCLAWDLRSCHSSRSHCGLVEWWQKSQKNEMQSWFEAEFHQNPWTFRGFSDFSKDLFRIYSRLSSRRFGLSLPKSDKQRHTRCLRNGAIKLMDLWTSLRELKVSYMRIWPHMTRWS